jgi:vancomycin resistance protein YoaR
MSPSRILLALLGGTALFLLTLGALIGGYRYEYEGKIFPGVTVGGVDVAGLTVDEAAGKLRAAITYPVDGSVAFQDGSTVWTAKPIELGFVFDPVGSAQAAYAIGRSAQPGYALAAQFQFAAYHASPRFIYDEKTALAYLQGLADRINVPTVEATLGLNGMDVVLHSGQVGRTLHLQPALDQLHPLLESLTDGLIELEIEETPPVIFDAAAQAAIARQILSAPLVIRDPDAPVDTPVEWTIQPETLAGMLTIERVATPEGGEAYQVGLRTSELVEFLNSIAPGLSITPQNARFIFNDDTRQLEVLENSVTGRALLVAETAEHINQQLVAGEHRINLVFDYLLPDVTSDASAQQLGITELVSSHTSYFVGSSTARVQNIRVAASRFHGLLVPPGAEFSMGEVLGDVSLDTGFAEALIIFGDRTIKGVGGGVCQVSTTLFRTVFFGGFQIDERYAHAYRVYYYEQVNASGAINTNYAGLDATVYVPLVDFKFTNDTEYWLLMETYVTNTSLTWKFYSTSDGRTVEWETTGLTNKEEPPKPLYEENKNLKKGEIRQVDWSVEGADVTVTRTVTRNGEVIHQDVFVTHYAPWRAVYEYGPGTKIPPQEDEEGSW